MGSKFHWMYVIMRQNNIGTTIKACTLSLSTVDVFFVYITEIKY